MEIDISTLLWHIYFDQYSYLFRWKNIPICALKIPYLDRLNSLFWTGNGNSWCSVVKIPLLPSYSTIYATFHKMQKNTKRKLLP